MIVRDSSSSWLLISQVEHARISAEIAANWNVLDVLEPLRNEVLFAVAHHDDGWAEWEQAPTIDEDGEPRDFMDMPMPVATGIWTASIEAGVSSSPWCGLWISRHFCYLAELALEHRDDGDDRAATQQFLSEQFAAQRQWRAEVGEPNVTAIETAGLHALQFFDRVSLWLCMAERTAEQAFRDPSGGETLWTPKSSTEIMVSGDGFTSNELSLSAPAVSIERRRYNDDAELRAAIAGHECTAVSWMLQRT